MEELICIKCPDSQFLDPKKEICWKTGGLYCKKLDRIVGKFDPCLVKASGKDEGRKRRTKTSRS